MSFIEYNLTMAQDTNSTFVLKKVVIANNVSPCLTNFNAVSLNIDLIFDTNVSRLKWYGEEIITSH